MSHVPRKRAPDLTGQVFGRWTVLGEDPVRTRFPNGSTRVYWLCQCQCGNPKLGRVARVQLQRGVSRSCGCLRKERMAIIGKTQHRRGRHGSHNLKGRVFGDLKVLEEFIEPSRAGYTQWVCLCRCGNPAPVIVSSNTLVSKGIAATKSCGHRRVEHMRRVGKSGIAHANNYPVR